MLELSAGAGAMLPRWIQLLTEAEACSRATLEVSAAVAALVVVAQLEEEEK